MVIDIVSPFTPRLVGIRGNILFSRSREVNVFVGVDNGLPAALPHVRPRPKILMALLWCCKVTPGRYLAIDLRFLWHVIGVVDGLPGQGNRGFGIPDKLLFSRSRG